MVSAIIILTVFGAVSGLLLAVVAKKFAVESDPRIEQISDNLPGANCGGCGYGGCAAYAKAIVTDGVDVNKCSPGGQTCADKIAAIMGVTAGTQETKFAVVHCAGDDRQCQKRAEFRGASTCMAQNAVAGGPKACTAGCLGCGDCATVCPTGAIKITEHHLAVVIPEKCIACGKCVSACPRKIITIESANTPYQVLCSSQDPAKEKRSYCQVACIGCKLCNKKAPEAFDIKGQVACAKANQEDMAAAEEGRLNCSTCAIVNFKEVSPVDWVSDPQKRADYQKHQAEVKAAAKAAKLAAAQATSEAKNV